jgi:NADH:ubiquinone oxidoreductase subunit 2 (subunit N)
MPPTLGFAARLLVLAAAFRLSLPLGLAVLAGVMLQLVASARVVLARLGDAARPAAAHHPRISERIAIALVVVALVAGGIAPGVVLSRVWGIG